MKASEFKKLIREEVQKVLKEASTAELNNSTVKSALKKLLNARKRDPEDENAHDEMEQYLVQLFTKMKVGDPESLASYMMEDEEFATGTVEGMISSIEFALEDEEAINERELEVGKAIGNIPAGVDRNRSTEFDKKSFDALAKTLKPLNNQQKAEYLAKVIEKLNLDRNTTIAQLRKLLQELS